MVAILKEPYPQIRLMHEEDLEQVAAIVACSAAPRTWSPPG